MIPYGHEYVDGRKDGQAITIVRKHTFFLGKGSAHRFELWAHEPLQVFTKYKAI